MKKAFFVVLFFIPILFQSSVHAQEPGLNDNNNPSLDQYKMHIKEAFSEISPPTYYRDAYTVSTTVILDNGLHVSFARKYLFQHLESAESEKVSEERRFSAYGTYPPETEVYFKNYAYYGTHTMMPTNDNISFVGSDRIYLEGNYIPASNCLPTIIEMNKVSIPEELKFGFLKLKPNSKYLEVTLSDGSIWRVKGWLLAPIVPWEIDDRILVSLNPEGALLINFDRKKDDWVFDRFFKYMNDDLDYR